MRTCTLLSSDPVGPQCPRVHVLWLLKPFEAGLPCLLEATVTFVSVVARGQSTPVIQLSTPAVRRTVAEVTLSPCLSGASRWKGVHPAEK